MRRSLCAVVLVSVLGLAWAAPAAAQDAAVVADALDNPRGLDVVGDALYVTEAGRGGDRCTGEDGAQQCFGLTGAVTRVDLTTGEQSRVATGLPSVAAADGSEASGPADIAFPEGTGRGALVTGLGGTPELRDELGAGAQRLGRLARVSTGGAVCWLTDLAAFEAEKDPDAGQPGAAVDSNPTSVALSGTRRIVVDAGGNSLLDVDGDGPSVLGVFPSRMTPGPGGTPEAPAADVPMQSVPTSVAMGPDGALYVGELTGFPFPTDAARVYRVPPEGGTPEVYASGFTHITDLAWGAEGQLYVLQFASSSLLGPPSPAKVVEIAADGTRTERAVEGLAAAAGLAVADDGTLYVSVGSASAGTGRVLAIPPAPVADVVLAELDHLGRHVRILDRGDRVEMELDGRVLSQRAFARVGDRYTSRLAPFRDYADPAELARVLVDGDGTLWVL